MTFFREAIASGTVGLARQWKTGAILRRVVTPPATATRLPVFFHECRLPECLAPEPWFHIAQLHTSVANTLVDDVNLRPSSVNSNSLSA